MSLARSALCFSSPAESWRLQGSQPYPCLPTLCWVWCQPPTEGSDDALVTITACAGLRGTNSNELDLLVTKLMGAKRLVTRLDSNASDGSNWSQHELSHTMSGFFQMHRDFALPPMLPSCMIAWKVCALLAWISKSSGLIRK